MKATKNLLVLLSFFVLLLMTACRTTPVRNVDLAPVPEAPAGKQLSMVQVEKAITLAGAELGWTTKVQSPGVILATIRLRDHYAAVNITYSTVNYSITYKDSTNLKYDGKTIHSNYNGWIENLDKAIRRNLAREAYDK
jgi:hypothetical protein